MDAISGTVEIKNQPEGKVDWQILKEDVPHIGLKLAKYLQLTVKGEVHYETGTGPLFRNRSNPHILRVEQSEDVLGEGRLDETVRIPRGDPQEAATLPLDLAR